MPVFGKSSRERLSQVHPDLVEVLEEAIKHYDFAILCGHRGKEEQDKAVAEGKSKSPWPTSKHNSLPSMAVDVAPYPIDWSDSGAFGHLAGFIEAIALQKGVKIRWGGDWNRNGRTKDESFMDLPHIELVD